jgi:hypothetical protein
MTARMVPATKLSGVQDVDIFKDEKDGKLREVGNQAVWSLSSCKPGKLSYFAKFEMKYKRSYII